MKKLLTIQLILVIFSLIVPFAALADEQQGVLLNPGLRPEYATNIELAGTGNRASLANAVLQMAAGGLIYLAGPIAVLMLALGGLRYITSRGDQTQMEEAKKTITWSVIGLIVIILSWAIITNIMWIGLHGGEIGTEQQQQYTQAPAQTPSGETAAGDTSGSGSTQPPAESSPETTPE